MKTLQSLALGCVLAIAASFACAQNISLGDALDKGATLLKKEELEALIPGSRHESRNTSGTSQRTWDHNKDGTLIGQVRGAFANQSPRGNGKWSVSDQGQYCVDISWGSSGQTQEKWCMFVYKMGEDLYAVRSTTERDRNLWPIALKK
jgi:Protein of unknown function (DUF995)